MDRVTEAADRLGTTARVLRRREALGLLGTRRAPGEHRRYGPDELAALRLGQQLEAAYGVTPAALAFAVRALTDPGVRSDVARLAGLVGRPPVAPEDVLRWEQDKASSLLRGPSPARAPGGQPKRTPRISSRSSAVMPPQTP